MTEALAGESCDQLDNGERRTVRDHRLDVAPDILPQEESSTWIGEHEMCASGSVEGRTYT